ncbi:MAG: 2-carboxy-1,4-naphthoquinone phytyltransferase [Cyanobacteria bacterium KgW148]|nr:2-carboxy-1,4-naphthoquinone phytyltransferase [Cyanobacteria bacterium KgW148]
MIATDRKKLWQAAIKLPMYSVAVMPIVVGSVLAWLDRDIFNWQRLGLFLLAGVCILAWENLCNDVFDAETGIDRHKYHSIVQLTNNPKLVFVIANTLLFFGLLFFSLIAWQQQDITVLLLVLLCCFLGYAYQSPPFRLGYVGLGEMLCFFAFAITIAAAYYSQVQSFSFAIVLPALINGLSTTLILFCSHFHQVEDDRSAGKFSPIVRLGTKRSAQIIPFVCISLYLLTLIGIVLHLLPWSATTIGISMPFAWQLVKITDRYHDQPEQIKNCKFIAVGLHFWSNLGLVIGLIVSHAL